MDQYKGYTRVCCQLTVAPIWSRQLLQTLHNAKQLVKYFPVRKPVGPQPITGLDSRIQATLATAKTQDHERHLHRHRIYNQETGKDTPWIQYTGWKRVFDNCDMIEWRKLIDLELAPGEEEIYKSVNNKVMEILEHAYKGRFHS